MSYELPNGRAVDTEGAVEAFLDKNAKNRYFLDLTTGEVGCVEKGRKGALEKLKSLHGERVRYKEIPRASVEDRYEWFEDFVKEIVPYDDRELSRKVLYTLYGEGYTQALTLLGEAKGDFLDGFDIWVEDQAFDVLGDWLEARVPGIMFKGCGDCEICRAEESGAGLEGLFEAFEKERKKNEDEQGSL